MDINVVYSGHQGPPALHHKSETGTVHVSEKRDPNKYNVFTHIVKPQENDCFIMQEPVVVRPQDYESKNLKDFHKVFTWFEGINLPNIEKIYFPSILNANTSLERLQNNTEWKDRADEVVIIANPKSSKHYASIYQLRIILADALHKNGVKVSWYGHQRLSKPYYKGPIHGDKFGVLEQAKFSICSENAYDKVYSKNYLTEKLPHVLIAGCMPIYMGCYNIEDFGISNDSMIDLRKYVKEKSLEVNIEALVNKIKNFSENDYKKYRESIYKERQNPDGIFHRTSYHTAYEAMLRSLNQ